MSGSSLDIGSLEKINKQTEIWSGSRIIKDQKKKKKKKKKERKKQYASL